MGHTLYFNLSVLLGLESSYKSGSKEGCWGGSWRESALSYMATALGETIIVSSTNVGLIPSNGNGEAASTGVGKASSIRGGETASFGKDDSSEFRGSMSPALYLGLLTHPLTPFRISLLPNECTYFNSRHSTDWEFNTLCNSASCRLRFYIWFSAISAL